MMKWLTFAMLALVAAPLAACERNEGAVEETGEELDQGLEETGEEIDQAGEEARESVE